MLPLLAGLFTKKMVGSAILSGISGLFGGKSKKKQAEAEAKARLEEIKASGTEQRKTSLYEAQLASAADEYGRERQRSAFKNFGYAGKNDPYAQKALQGYEQVWKPEDTKLKLPNDTNYAAPR